MTTQIGDILDIPAVAVDNNVYHDHSIIRHWTVTAVYPHHVVAEADGMRESFTYGQLVQLGIEKQADKYEALRTERSSHWFSDDYKRSYDDTEVEE